MSEPDPRLLRLLRELDEERQRRIAAEKQAAGLRSVITRLQRQRTNDAIPELEWRAEC